MSFVISYMLVFAFLLDQPGNLRSSRQYQNSVQSPTAREPLVQLPLLVDYITVSRYTNCLSWFDSFTD